MSPEVSQQVSPEPRRRQRHFAEPNGHIPNAGGDDTNKIEVIHEETIQVEGTIIPEKVFTGSSLYSQILYLEVTMMYGVRAPVYNYFLRRQYLIATL